MLLNNDITIGYRISFLANRLMNKIYGRIRVEEGLNRSEGASLFCLGHRQPLTAIEISEMTGRPRNSISAAVSKLTKGNYIERRLTDANQRIELLHLSERGLKSSDNIRNIFIHYEREMLEYLPNEDDRKRLNELLGILVFEVPPKA